MHLSGIAAAWTNIVPKLSPWCIMASIESRNGSTRIVFRHNGRRHKFTIGDVDAQTAEIYRSSTDELLRLLKRNFVSVPAGSSIEDFMYHRGKPPEKPAATNGQAEQSLTLETLRDTYYRSQQKKLEQTTLIGISLHFRHLVRILGGANRVADLKRADLQRYVDKRSQEWIDPNVYRRKRREKEATRPRRNFTKPRPSKAEPPDKPKRHPSAATIKKEIVTLRTAWNWARRHLELAPEFPGTRLDYAKIAEGLPFMTWDEAERRIAAGDDPDEVWGCVYLRPREIAELLAWVSKRPVSPWVYPIFCFAAHTGTRRSEIVRVLPSDVDLASGGVTIREKKRDKTRTTTRRVPLTPFLKDVLADWVQRRGNGKMLFCKDNGQAILPGEITNYFIRTLRTGKWNVLRGMHVFRHSFISAMASKGIDQRIIDSFVGHCTDEQRRRYAHLYPDVQQHAMQSVFG
jgi:integrase